MYLRKSRQDDPNETVEEVLAKHEADLQEYAERELGGRIPEENIYREVISAESIDARVEFKKVLARIEDPNIQAVLVVDPQRLSRGDLGDCDKLIKSFQLTKTQVLTRRGGFDLSNDRERKFFQDELLRGRDYYEYVRDTLFMGRIRSAKRGCFIGQFSPYGYRKIKIGKDHTLEIVEDEAEIIRMIFKLYTDEGLTSYGISLRLNEMGVKAPRGDEWKKDTIRKMLENEHYIGRVVYNKIKRTPVLENGEIKSKRLTQPEEERIVAEGKHPAIIDMETWEKAQSRIALNPRNTTKNAVLRNPLSGILRCSKCGKVMFIHLYKHSSNRYECRTRPRCYKSVSVSDIRAALIIALEQSHLPDLETRVKNDDGNARKIQQKLLDKLEKQMLEYRDQEEQQYDLLETRQYTQDVFNRRNAKLRAKMEECQMAIYKTKATLPESVDFVERVATLKSAIAALKTSELTPAEENRLLKTIIERIEYTGPKSTGPMKKGVKQGHTEFTLEVFLRL
jgi:hypothetical protein